MSPGTFRPAHPTKQTKRLIKRAARLRVEGNSWAVIAPRIGRKNELTARHITAEYPEAWAAAYEKARAEHLSEVEVEGLLTQRELMRPMRPVLDEYGRTKRDEAGQAFMQRRDEDTRQHAAHSVLAHVAKLHALKLHITGDVGIQSNLAEMIYAAHNGGFRIAEGGLDKYGLPLPLDLKDDRGITREGTGKNKN